jgi:hypothetical protein
MHNAANTTNPTMINNQQIKPASRIRHFRVFG